MFGQAVLRRLLDNMGQNSPFELYSFRCMKTEVAFGKKAGSGQVITSLQGPSGAFGGLEPVQIIYTLKKKNHYLQLKSDMGMFIWTWIAYTIFIIIYNLEKKTKKKNGKIWFCFVFPFTRREEKNTVEHDLNSPSRS